MFVNLALSRRLERAEGHACKEFAEARRRVFPERNSTWIECAGTHAIFDGIGAPTTQTFGLGLFEQLTPELLDMIEGFFFERGAQVDHEVSPFAGVAAFDLLCSRRYRPIDLTSVLFRRVEPSAQTSLGHARARLADAHEAQLWADISAKGWAPEHPEFEEFQRQFSQICTARKGSPFFLAEFDGQPGAAGVLSIYEGVALFGGASTIPELRRRGLQSALLEERMRYAQEQGCDLAMMVAAVGSDSQRNAERKGFRVAYTRIKWRLTA